eukprot:g5153.t1
MSCWQHFSKNQLSSKEANGFEFDNILDLIPNDEKPFIHSLHPDFDARSPLTYSKLHALSQSIGNCSTLAGLPRGARIAASLPNGPEIATLFLALSGLGDRFTFAPLNPDLSEDEATFELSDLPAACLIVPPAPLGKPGTAARAATKLSSGIRIVELVRNESVCGLFHLRHALVTETSQVPAVDNEEVATAEELDLKPVHTKRSSRSAFALVMHTSGTTRRPKIVPLSHSQLGTGAICVASTLQLSRNSLSLNVMPLFHLHGLMINILVTAVAGAQVVCAPRFVPSLFFQWLKAVPPASKGKRGTCMVGRPAPTWYSAVPTIHQEVLRYAELHSPLQHSLTLIRNCSAALAPSIARRLETALPGVIVLTTYAMTEALPICSNSLDSSHNVESVGPAMGPEVRIIQASYITGSKPNFLPANEEGEVVVRGDCVFHGYEKREHLGFDPNEHAFLPGGWFRTGDKGWIDDQGHIHLTGRFKEVINRAGEKISPLSVEHGLLAMAPSIVRSLLVFACPHDELGEVVGVAIVCEKGKTVSLTEVRRAGVKGGLLGKRWLPELLVHVNEIPKGPTGKPARIGLAKKWKLHTAFGGSNGLSLSNSMKTLDLRNSKKKMNYEAARRAEHRSKAKKKMNEKIGKKRKKRSGSRANESIKFSGTMESCVALVVDAMTIASGQAVSEEDDLFDAGLSSISAARLREELSCRTKLGDALPHNLVYHHTTVRDLAAAILHIYRSSNNDEDSSSMSLSLLTAKAKEEFQDGDVMEAETICLQGLVQYTTLSEKWYYDLVQKFFNTEMKEEFHDDSLRQIIDQTQCKIIVELDGIKRREVAAVLVLLLGIWRRLKKFREACVASTLLIALEKENAKEKKTMIDIALLWAQFYLLFEQLESTNKKTCVASILANHAATLKIASLDNIETETNFSIDTLDGDEELRPVGKLDDTEGEALITLKESSCCEKVKRKERNVNCIYSNIDRMSHESSYFSQFKMCKICSTMQVLVLRQQKLSMIPSCIGEMQSLRVLDISNNQIACLDRSVFVAKSGIVLPNLEEIIASRNRLTSLPQILSLLPMLSVLNIQANRFAVLPPVVLQCKFLSIFRWSNQFGFEKRKLDRTQRCCQIANDVNFSTVNLKVIDLQGNGISRLPWLGPDKKASRLTTLLASHNNLKAIPTQVALCTSLKVAYFGSNGIASINDDILESLSNLTCLMLEGNKLTSLPRSIGNLKQLRELAVFGNYLTSLPSELGMCTQLVKLDAHHNFLETIPESFVALQQLKSLYLQDNQLNDLNYLKSNIFDKLPALSNLALGLNLFDFSKTSKISINKLKRTGTRIGLAWNNGIEKQAKILTDYFGTCDCLFEPACKSICGDILVIAFAAQGAGMQQWTAPISAARSAGISVDALYMADPSNSYYMQTPSHDRTWNGPKYYRKIIERYTEKYKRVLMIGSSMGGTAALIHSHLADRTLSFGPRICLESTHGSYLGTEASVACEAAVMESLKASTGRVNGRNNRLVTVHVGSLNLEDCLQTVSLPDNVRVQFHDTFHHNVPMFLQRGGLLVDLFKHELLSLMKA